MGAAEGKRADSLVLEGKHEAAEELYRIQLTHLESRLLDTPNPQLQQDHRAVLEKLAKLNQHRLRRYEAAIGDWTRLIETHPDSELAVEAGLAVAELYRYRLERPKEAIAAYESLRGKIQSPLTKARVSLELADLLFELKRFDQVEDITSKVQTTTGDPKLGYRATFLRARALTTLDRHLEAVEAWSQLEFPEHPSIAAQVLFEKSFALEASGQRIEAIEALHAALENHPNPSLVQGMLGDLKTRTKMSEGGRAIHGAKTPRRLKPQARQAPLTSPKKTVKAATKGKTAKQSSAAQPKKKKKTQQAGQINQAKAAQPSTPKVEAEPAAKAKKAGPSKAATTSAPPPKTPAEVSSPTPDSKASDTPK